MRSTLLQREVDIQLGHLWLAGDLVVPEMAQGFILFAHGSGSSRLSPRNQQVAHQLNAAGYGTLLFDLLAPQERIVDEQTAELRFDIDLLASRLTATVDWVLRQRDLESFNIGLFGASTGAAAALVTAAERQGEVSAVVSRGGRPDLAAQHLPHVTAPSLMIVGEEDPIVAELNRQAMRHMRCKCELQMIPGATHLFSEAGKLEQVADMARQWFDEHLVYH